MPDAPGRNDPCPCGSGRKYKKCCLAGAEASASANRPAPDARAGALQALIRFAYSDQFATDHAIASALFWAGRLDGMDERAQRQLVENDDTAAKYNMWFVFDLDIDEGRTVADIFLAQRGWTLGRDERQFIERARVAPMRLYQVESIEFHTGVHLIDLWTKARIFVHERLGTEQMVRWDLLGARVVPDQDGRAMFEGGLYLYPVGAKADLLKTFKRDHRRCLRVEPELSLDLFFRRQGMLFHHAWLDLVALKPLPRMVTAEGDEMMFTRVVFDLLDEPALRAALAGCDDVDVQEDGAFVWLEDAGDMCRTLGTLTLDGARASFEATSRARGDRARAWLESLAGAAVAYRATAFETVAQALARTAAADPSDRPRAEVPPEIEAEILQDTYDRHYQAWLDQPIRALRDHTPRQAAQSSRLRPLLRDLLQLMDNQAERAKSNGRFAYDSRWIWTELGLTAP